MNCVKVGCGKTALRLVFLLMVIAGASQAARCEVSRLLCDSGARGLRGYQNNETCRLDALPTAWNSPPEPVGKPDAKPVAETLPEKTKASQDAAVAVEIAEKPSADVRQDKPAEDGYDIAVTSMGPATLDFYGGSGVMVPKDSDIDIAPMLVAGFRFSQGRDSLFIEYYNSRPQTGGAPDGEPGHITVSGVTAGYLRNITGSKRLRAGGGIEIIQMTFNSDCFSRTTFAGLAEYDFAKNWTLQLKSTQVVKVGNIRVGSFDLRVARDY